MRYLKAVLYIIITAVIIGMGYYTFQADAEHRETRILALVATITALLGTGISAWSSKTASEKAMRGAVRPFVLVSQVTYAVKPNITNVAIFAENTGKGSAHNTTFEIEGKDTNYRKRMSWGTFREGQKKTIAIITFGMEDKKFQEEHYGEVKMLGNARCSITYTDSNNEEYRIEQERIPGMAPECATPRPYTEDDLESNEST